MKSFDKFLSHLRSVGIKLYVDGERLRYRGPEKNITPALLAEIAERKTEILTFLRKARSTARSIPSSILPVSRDRELSLSFAQERLWFLDRFEPNSSFYNMQSSMPFLGSINVSALKRSLNEIVNRHEVLRTTFDVVDGRAVQTIADFLTVDLPVIDLRHMSESEKEAEAQRVTTEESQRPFDLKHGPLLRTALLRLNDEVNALLLTMHHIVSDGWSMGIFFRELRVLYEASCNWKPSPLPDLPIQYADFAYWQRQWLKGEVLEGHISYWKKQLEGAPTVLELPTDRPRPAVQTFRGALQSFVLSPSVTDALHSLSRKEGVTLFMTLLSAFKVLLHRYTGQEDIVVGAPIANRNKEEIEGLIGFFVNTLILRTKPTGKLSFRELLWQVRTVTLEAYSHQDLPFEKLVAELQPERKLTHNPLFQVMFALQNIPALSQASSEQTRGLPQIVLNIAKFDLTLFVTEIKEGLMVSFEYNSDLFDASTITRMGGHFQTLINNITKDPEQRLADLPLLTTEERKQLLIEWNSTKEGYPDDKCIHQLFEAQVERTPDALAVVFENEQLTYGELNQHANQVGHYLRKLGVGPEVCVGISMERSLDMVVGILGILKAGGAYVPLDQTYPKERLAFMKKDAQVKVLLTEEKILRESHEQDLHVICLDASLEEIARENVENPNSEVISKNLAYVIYTSGSTGMPKGVAMNHSPLVNLIAWQISNSTLSSGAKTLQFASMSFDVSFQEMFTTWCSGGTLVLATEEERRDARKLLRHIKDAEIERLFLPPLVLQKLAEEFNRTLVPTKVREIITAGEQLQITRPIADFLTILENCTLRNQYGPSESHVVSEFNFADSLTIRNALPPIGKSIANTLIYLLDKYLQPVPIGVPGELYIGGVGLARGYFNRPDLMAEKFIPNPFSEEPGERLYKTGDLARYLADGNIEFLGRIDQQVKIRGFRIELGEVESVLCKHPAVRDAVAVVREDIPDVKRLVVYLVPQQENVCMSSELHSFLKGKLPEYMVPSVFVPLETIPLTPSGKVDRKALPIPEMVRPESKEDFEAPRSPVEETLVEIWKDVLGLKQVSINDNFFELGGHSLLATQVFSRILETLHLDIPVRLLFEAPTIAELSVDISKYCEEEEDSEEMVRILA